MCKKGCREGWGLSVPPGTRCLYAHRQLCVAIGASTGCQEMGFNFSFWHRLGGWFWASY